ncbi:MAG: winged helix-turn-helix domain-containing protein, partial [Ilumatobacteraceae bacterium]
SQDLPSRFQYTQIKGPRRVNHPAIETDKSQEIIIGRIAIRPTAHEVFINDTAVGFTRTEFKVLVELGSVSPDTVTRAGLLDCVWGYDYLGDTRLVDMQIYRIRAKLEPHGLSDKLFTVRGVGFKLLP